jgi:hypothetical protein
LTGNRHTARTQDVVAISFNRGGLRGVLLMGNSTVIFDNSFRGVQISPDTQGQPHQEKINLQLCTPSQGTIGACRARHDRLKATARHENEVSNLLPHSSDERWCLGQLWAVPFFLYSSLSVASALACNLRPPLSTISRVPAEAFTWFGCPVEFCRPTEEVSSPFLSVCSIWTRVRITRPW